MRPLLPALISVALGCGAALAAPLDEAQIRELFTDNTVTGYSTEGRFFSEYHQADGRVFGDNGYYINTDACWTTKPAQSATTMARVKRGPFIASTSTGRGCIDHDAGAAQPARWHCRCDGQDRKGNPRKHNDGGHAWFCDGLISRWEDRQRQASAIGLKPRG